MPRLSEWGLPETCQLLVLPVTWIRKAGGSVGRAAGFVAETSALEHSSNWTLEIAFVRHQNMVLPKQQLN